MSKHDNPDRTALYIKQYTSVYKSQGGYAILAPNPTTTYLEMIFMPQMSLAAHLAVSPPVTGPLNFIGLIEQWLQSAGSSVLSTPEARASVVRTVMGVYDSLAVNIGRTNVALAALFGAFRPTVEGLVNSMVNAFTPVPAPVVPVTVVTPVPQGSARE